MDMLKNFRNKDFKEKINILGEIEKSRDHTAIPQLFDLHANPVNDNSVDFMIYETLRTLLSESEEKTVEGLRSENKNVQKLCVHVAGENRFASAGPVLKELIEDEQTSDLLFDILSALSRIRTPEHLGIFQKFLNHPDDLTSALCIEMLGVYGDTGKLQALYSIVTEGESDERYENCSIATYKTIEALGAIGCDEAVSFLVSKIHHRNPSARRIIQEELFKKGADIIPFVANHFEQGDVDLKIIAANLLGLIGDNKGADVMVAAVDKGVAEDPNVKQAIYEALGTTPSMKGVACLMDGLSTEDDLLLIAVIFSLNAQINPGVIAKIKELISAGNAQSNRLLRAIVASKAFSLFEALHEDEKIAEGLIESITKINDSEIISDFYIKLVDMGSERAKSDAERIENSAVKDTGKKVLAVDDSRAMLLFYRTAASDLGLDLTTTTNGKEALECLKQEKTFDLIITDMNMPIMDGIEFTRTIKEDPALKAIPVIMATTESEKSQARLAQNAGVSSFIKKPFTVQILQNKIKPFLSQPG